MRLENWSVFSDANPYQAPELGRKYLQGYVLGHPSFNDGEHVHTTAIVAAEDGVIVTASGSRYELGEVDPGYEAQYPGARERLLKAYAGRRVTA